MMPKPALLALITFELITLTAHLIAADIQKPNIILIVVDDMGYGDLGCTGSTTIKTHNIDSLAAGGIFCSRGYVASTVCSPSRAGLLTGRHPRRFGYEGNLNGDPEEYSTRPAGGRTAPRSTTNTRRAPSRARISTSIDPSPS